MEPISRTLSTTLLITAFVLGAALPAAAGDAVWKESTNPDAAFVAPLDTTQGEMDGVLERLASRSQTTWEYAGVAERLAARLPGPGAVVVAAAPGGCGDEAVLAE